MRRTAGMLYDELIATGEARGRILTLLHIGTALFGEASDRVRERLQMLSPEQITAVTERLVRVTSWDEALG